VEARHEQEKLRGHVPWLVLSSCLV
jgi:hypothetical protein